MRHITEGLFLEETPQDEFIQSLAQNKTLVFIMFASIWSFGVESLIYESKKLMEVCLFFDELKRRRFCFRTDAGVLM